MDEAHTTTSTRCRATASSTLRVPTALAAHVTSGRRVGWNIQARWTTAWAPANTSSRSSCRTSAARQRTDASGAFSGTVGLLRATARTSYVAAEANSR